MAKHTKVFLAVALLSLLYSSLQAQGRSVAYDASMKWVPVSKVSTMYTREVHPDGFSLKNCDRCTCCAGGVICQTMNCCIESTPAPGGGWSTRTLSCNCDSNTCV